ncbi:MAG: hypothetical protein IAE78_14805 [Myxococcus sp.]|nr:hypothetical protein [Myxococcus sp.]
MTSLVVLSLLAAVPLPQECEPPPLHDVAPLKTYAQKSGTLSVGLDSVATWCFDSSGTWTGGNRADPGKKARPIDPNAPAVGDCARSLASCDEAKLALTAELTQALADALADLERPFRGQKYVPKRTGLNERPPTAVNCKDRSRPDLFAQAQARMDLARLASTVQNEYANYKTWLFARGLECAQQVRSRGDATRVAMTVDSVAGAGGGAAGAAAAGGAAMVAMGPKAQGGVVPKGALVAAVGVGAPGSGANVGGTNAAGTNSGGTNVGGTNSSGTNSSGTNVGGTNSGGTNSAGTNSAGTNSGGTNVGGTNVAGTNSGGTNVAGANVGSTNSGGANSGGTNSGGTNSGGTNVGGTNAAGTNSGGTNVAGTNSGGTNSGGTNVGGTNVGGTNVGGTNVGGTNSGGTNSGGANVAGTNSGGANVAGTNSGGTNVAGTNVGGTNSGGTTVATNATPLIPALAPTSEPGANTTLETWRGLAAQRAKLELDRDYTLGFLASRELRDCRCQRSSPSGIVSRLETGDGVAQLEADNQRAVACELCLQNAFAAWRGRVQKQCALVNELSPYELEVLQRSDDGNGLPPRCIQDAIARRGLDAGIFIATPPSTAKAVVPATTLTVALPSADAGTKVAPAPMPPPTGMPRFEPPSAIADGFFRPSEPAPMPLREDGRLYVRVFMSSTCAADVLPGPILARTGDLLLIPWGARQLSLRSPCGGLAEVYWGREPMPRVSEVFGRNQPLHLQFKPQ